MQPQELPKSAELTGVTLGGAHTAEWIAESETSNARKDVREGQAPFGNEDGGDRPGSVSGSAAEDEFDFAQPAGAGGATEEGQQAQEKNVLQLSEIPSGSSSGNESPLDPLAPTDSPSLTIGYSTQDLKADRPQDDLHSATEEVVAATKTGCPSISEPSSKASIIEDETFQNPVPLSNSLGMREGSRPEGAGDAPLSQPISNDDSRASASQEPHAVSPSLNLEVLAVEHHAGLHAAEQATASAACTNEDQAELICDEGSKETVGSQPMVPYEDSPYPLEGAAAAKTDGSSSLDCASCAPSSGSRNPPKETPKGGRESEAVSAASFEVQPLTDSSEPQGNTGQHFDHDLPKQRGSRAHPRVSFCDGFVPGEAEDKPHVESEGFRRASLVRR